MSRKMDSLVSEYRALSANLAALRAVPCPDDAMGIAKRSLAIVEAEIAQESAGNELDELLFRADLAAGIPGAVGCDVPSVLAMIESVSINPFDLGPGHREIAFLARTAKKCAVSYSSERLAKGLPAHRFAFHVPLLEDPQHIIALLRTANDPQESNLAARRQILQSEIRSIAVLRARRMQAEADEKALREREKVWQEKDYLRRCAEQKAELEAKAAQRKAEYDADDALILKHQTMR